MAPRKTLGKDEEIKIFYEHGVYISTRTVVIESVRVDDEHGESGVDAHMWSRLQKGLDILENWPVAEGKDDTITIVMNNPGGDAYHMLGMYDRLRMSPCPVIIKASGHIMSAGSIIFQAADVRQMHPHATMMIHYGRESFSGNVLDFIEAARECERIVQIMHDIYLGRIQQKHPRFNLDQLVNMLRSDRWLSAHEAVKLGLADEVIPYPEQM